MTNKTHKNKTTQNIEFLIGIGQFKLRLSLPKHTTVAGLVSIVKGYDALHLQYGPQGLPFIGLTSSHVHPLVDYWLTQPSLDFAKFRRKLQLRCLYACERRSDRVYIGEFECLVCLGKGTYGSVYLVRSRITGALMALKRVAKEHITNYQSLMTQFRERKNMIRMGHNSHTVNLHACFQSRGHFNFLMEYYPGGELFLHLSSPQRQKLTNQHIKQYFCQIILAVQYIHKKKVLYRDLKPENIFVDVAGHLRIGDFGMSKCDFEEDDFTASICGSQQYMAPEILENHNYNFSADFYSIGAILYELLTGVPPYYNQCQNFKDYRNIDQFRLELIKSKALDYSKATENPYLQQLLSNLLHPDPQNRISNFQQIKNSPWLSGVDWKSIQNKYEHMPFAPDPSASIETYIGKQFLQLQDQVDQINLTLEDDTFSSQISEAFEYIRPESRRLLGLQYEVNMVKPKAKGSVKEKQRKCMPKKANLSVALFDREDTICQSVCSEPRSKGENKQNMGPLKRDRSKKFINLSKQTHNGLSSKNSSNNQTPLTRQKTHRGTLAPFSYNYSECSSRNVSECAIRLPSECSSKRDSQKQPLKKASSRGRQLGRGESRDKSKGRSIDKKMKQTSLSKHGMMRRKEDKKMLPTCSFKIKLT